MEIWQKKSIPLNNFLYIFILASSPGVHTFFCLWRVNKKLPQGETSKCISEVKVNQLKVKNIHVKWAYPPLMYPMWAIEFFQTYAHHKGYTTSHPSLKYKWHGTRRMIFIFVFIFLFFCIPVQYKSNQTVCMVNIVKF